jgi:hypothetical protein
MLTSSIDFTTRKFTVGNGAKFDHGTAEGSFHMTCGINGAKDQISREIKNHCSILSVESIPSHSSVYTRKTQFVFRLYSLTVLNQSLYINGILGTDFFVINFYHRR